jgi:peptidoglycan/xylan/chitin deacetylase (PgdA/CDA1 family)
MEAIDWEISRDATALQHALGVQSHHFRPPFGIVGARTRQRLAALVPGSKAIMWSVDVQDWLWGDSATPEKQLDAFKADVARGGNLVVMHYLFESTVKLLPQFIEVARGTGKRIVTVNECLGEKA